MSKYEVVERDKDLEVKEVDFNGATLLGIRDVDDKVYVAVTWVCEGIGLTEKQKDRQVSNIQKDVVLSKGVKKLPPQIWGTGQKRYRHRVRVSAFVVS